MPPPHMSLPEKPSSLKRKQPDYPAQPTDRRPPQPPQPLKSKKAKGKQKALPIPVESGVPIPVKIGPTMTLRSGTAQARERAAFMEHERVSMILSIGVFSSTDKSPQRAVIAGPSVPTPPAFPVNLDWTAQYLSNFIPPPPPFGMVGNLGLPLGGFGFPHPMMFAAQQMSTMLPMFGQLGQSSGWAPAASAEPTAYLTPVEDDSSMADLYLDDMTRLHSRNVDPSVEAAILDSMPVEDVSMDGPHAEDPVTADHAVTNAEAKPSTTLGIPSQLESTDGIFGKPMLDEDGSPYFPDASRTLILEGLHKPAFVWNWLIQLGEPTARRVETTSRGLRYAALIEFATPEKAIEAFSLPKFPGKKTRSLRFWWYRSPENDYLPYDLLPLTSSEAKDVLDVSASAEEGEIVPPPPPPPRVPSDITPLLDYTNGRIIGSAPEPNTDRGIFGMPLTKKGGHSSVPDKTRTLVMEGMHQRYCNLHFVASWAATLGDPPPVHIEIDIFNRKVLIELDSQKRALEVYLSPKFVSPELIKTRLWWYRKDDALEVDDRKPVDAEMRDELAPDAVIASLPAGNSAGTSSFPPRPNTWTKDDEAVGKKSKKKKVAKEGAPQASAAPLARAPALDITANSGATPSGSTPSGSTPTPASIPILADAPVVSKSNAIPLGPQRASRYQSASAAADQALTDKLASLREKVLASKRKATLPSPKDSLDAGGSLSSEVVPEGPTTRVEVESNSTSFVVSVSDIGSVSSAASSGSSETSPSTICASEYSFVSTPSFSAASLLRPAIPVTSTDSFNDLASAFITDAIRSLPPASYDATASASTSFRFEGKGDIHVKQRQLEAYIADVKTLMSKYVAASTKAQKDDIMKLIKEKNRYVMISCGLRFVPPSMLEPAGFTMH